MYVHHKMDGVRPKFSSNNVWPRVHSMQQLTSWAIVGTIFLDGDPVWCCKLFEHMLGLNSFFSRCTDLEDNVRGLGGMVHKYTRIIVTFGPRFASILWDEATDRWIGQIHGHTISWSVSCGRDCVGIQRRVGIWPFLLPVLARRAYREVALSHST